MTVYAQQFLDSNGGIVDSAAKLAEHVVGLLGPDQPLEISFAGMRGLSSSYFNVLLRRIADARGINSIGTQVLAHFESDAQRQVYQRSLEVLKQTAV